ncbi:MAG: cyclic nucleotide-binding domain-containing protein [Gammaproteobacteria bacterium]|nr:cyclic nucleotide-binding domain-containing protein [Gammaproteobacteria bacterium]
MTEKEKIISCMDCPDLQTTEWKVLAEAELASMDKCKRVIAFEPGEMLFSQGEQGNGVYCIKSGLIGLRRIDINGNSALIRLINAGSTVGYRTFLTGKAHINSAEALTSSTLCYVPRPNVEKLLQANPLLGERFLQHFYDDAIDTENDYVRSLTMGMKSRFLHLILVFYERFGYQDENGNAVVQLPVKKGEIAELVGVRPESISRLIDQLQTDEIMRFKDRRVEFSDVDRVLQQAGATV